LGHVKRRLEELPKEERRLVEGYRKGFYADFMMREEMERIRSERSTAEERQKELGLQLSRLGRALSYRGQVEEFARRVSQGLDQMDFVQRRELLRLVVDEIVYDDGQLTIKTIIPFGERQLHPIPQRPRGKGSAYSYRGVL
jgi:site-specific DNA recombinase